MIREAIRNAMERTPSLVHVVVPLVSYAIDPSLALFLTLCYIYYQYIDYLNKEPPAENQIDIIEWMLGLFLGAVIRLL